jgi:glutamine amidotransferase
MSVVGIIDYGMGNLHSVQKAFGAVGVTPDVISRPDQAERYHHLVLPGVGAFGDAMANLRSQQLVEPILLAIERGTSFLGICLGMQVLFSTSDEMGDHKGLGVLAGRVHHLQVSAKVPHMGWNQIVRRAPTPLLTGVRDGSYVYYANSYVVFPDDPTVVAAETTYEVDFPAVIWRRNVHGVQFHPEKSQRTGLQILLNFVERC